MSEREKKKRKENLQNNLQNRKKKHFLDVNFEKIIQINV